MFYYGGSDCKFICDFISEIEDLFPNEEEQVIGITNCDVSSKQEDNTLIIPPSIAAKFENDFDSPKLDVTTCKNEGMFLNIKSLHIFLVNKIRCVFVCQFK